MTMLSISRIPLDHAVIDYDKRPLDDAVTRLQGRLDSGEVKLAYEPNHGGLDSILGFWRPVLYPHRTPVDRIRARSSEFQGCA